MQVSLFRFDNYLALSPGFLASVHSIWRHTIVGTPMYSVTRKLKALKPVFRQQRRCKGDLAMNVKLAAGFLEVAQNILKLDRHNSLLLLLEHCCRLVYLKASKLEQVMLRQRAKLQWLKGGDQCSRIFFRRVATRSIFVEFFQDLLGGDRTARAIDLLYLRPWARHILSDDEARAIIRPVTIDEVKTAFFNIEEDKAPGPDGFSSGFFKAAWPVVGGEVSIAIMDFFKTGRLLKQVNATLLTLIPKVRTPHSVAEFRPISCCNVIYKVITKILVSRIRESLDLLISPSQNAFVPGRLISDNILLAQELFSGYNQCRLPPRCALKVDQRKAYDTVEWDFLIATLQMFGFPDMFNGWIEKCVTSAHYSVVVNGGVHGFFAGHGVSDRETPCPHIFLFCRIKGWEGVQLSFAGRVQLIKSVLISFEVYWATVFILPKGIIKEMIKRLRTFLWKVIKQDRTCIWVDWIIQVRLGDCSIWTVKENKGAWGWRKMLSLRLSLMSHIHYRVGNGDSISLWHDPWHPLGPLISRFPRGPQLTSTGLLDKLSVVIKERISWKSKDGSIKTSTAYELFHPPGPKVHWSFLLMGSFKIPKNCFILWLAIMGRLSTLDKPWLHHIGGNCILCQDGVPETHDHLFFSCSFSRSCFAIIRQQIPLPWPTGIGNMVFNGRHPDGVESMWLTHHLDLYWHQLSTTSGRNAMQGASSSVVDHPRLWASLLWRRLDRGSLVSLYDILFAHLVFIDYGKSLGLSRVFHLTFLYCLSYSFYINANYLHRKRKFAYLFD
ncbi:Transposon TX1 uncharacterized protein [Sesamum angolense]|uniref:Transposon TX1 uncharacterized protein n=1 Tax=Sesamum angolense TaxID=2727404 RepID=A0AAE1W128_9LAMI|nr:Transposon TX1 uncharacterized protein [Sesamum angolense]